MFNLENWRLPASGMSGEGRYCKGLGARSPQIAQHDSTSNDAARADAAIDLDRKTLTWSIFGDSQALKLLSVRAPVEHEIKGPHLVGAGRRLRPRPGGHTSRPLQSTLTND